MIRSILLLALLLPAVTADARQAPPDQAGPPKVGDVAPDLKLWTYDIRREVELSSFRGEKPVVLLFGSYT